MSQWFVTEKLGATQSFTPEGFLLCMNVPVARTGLMMYAPGEIPVTPGRDGIIRITRTAEDLFRPETLASFNGKPIANDHPEETITPLTWQGTSVGHMQAIRRGSGVTDDVMYADFMICEAQAIEDVRAGKREVSLGYDADYVEDSPGYGRQTNIIGNHVAMVDKGRCGPRCSIGDRIAPTFGAQQEDTEVASWQERMGIAVRTKDFRSMDALMGELAGRDDSLPNPAGPGDPLATGAGPDASNTHRIIVNVHGGAKPDVSGDAGAGAPPAPGAAPGAPSAPGAPPAGAPAGDPMHACMQQINATLQQILAAVSGGEETDPPGEGEGGEEDEPDGGDSIPPQTDDDMEDLTGDTEVALVQKPMNNPGTRDRKITKKAPARDSAGLAAQFQDVIARAEVLAPGISVPTFDAKATAVKTADSIARLQRRAIKAAMEDAIGKQAVAPFMGPKPAPLATMDCACLNGIFMGASELMKHANTKGPKGSPTADGPRKGTPTLAEMNKMNREFWDKQNGTAH
jgi:hypothetical protein